MLLDGRERLDTDFLACTGLARPAAFTGSFRWTSDVAMVLDAATGHSGGGPRLLVVGPPGPSSTLALIEVAQCLTDLHGDRFGLPVIFDLRGWTEHDIDLVPWMVRELRWSTVLVDDADGTLTGWVTGGRIAPMLEGLDEIADRDTLQRCVRAINGFADRSPPHTALVVTRRPGEHLAPTRVPPEHLAVNAVITIGGPRRDDRHGQLRDSVGNGHLARVHEGMPISTEGARRTASTVVVEEHGQGLTDDALSVPWRSVQRPTGHLTEVDLSVAPPHRIAVYGAGGDAHFSVDREVAEQMFASVPGGAAEFRVVARAEHAFVKRAVRYMTADAGIRQFLVTGSSLAGGPNVHELVQDITPDVRVVYLVVDAVELAHAHRLLRSGPAGATAYIQAKVRDTDEVLRQAAVTLDLSQPVGVIFRMALAFVRRFDTAYRIVTELMAGVGSGSYLALSHHASDVLVERYAEMFRCIARLAAEGKTWAVAPRSHADISRFFDGLELVEPGVVPIWKWRVPDGEQPPDGAVYGALGRKP